MALMEINNQRRTTLSVMIVCIVMVGLTLIHGASAATQLKSSGETVSGSVYYRDMNMYYINVDSVSSMSVQFTNSFSSSVYVYVRANQPPTTSNYDSVITYPGVSKTIITLKNSTLTQPYYIGVYGVGSSYNSYSLQVSVLSAGDIANWVIGVIVAVVIITILCAVASVLVPILVCCGVISCGVCCGAATGTAIAAGSTSGGGNGSYHQIHNNHVYHHSTTTQQQQPIAQQQTYYSGEPQYYTQPTTYQ